MEQITPTPEVKAAWPAGRYANLAALYAAVTREHTMWIVTAQFTDGVTSWTAAPMGREAANNHADELVQRADVLSVAVTPVAS